jgi:hypothetical protein
VWSSDLAPVGGLFGMNFAPRPGCDRHVGAAVACSRCFLVAVNGGYFGAATHALDSDGSSDEPVVAALALPGQRASASSPTSRILGCTARGYVGAPPLTPAADLGEDGRNTSLHRSLQPSIGTSSGRRRFRACRRPGLSGVGQAARVGQCPTRLSSEQKGLVQRD